MPLRSLCVRRVASAVKLHFGYVEVRTLADRSTQHFPCRRLRAASRLRCTFRQPPPYGIDDYAGRRHSALLPPATSAPGSGGGQRVIEHNESGRRMDG